MDEFDIYELIFDFWNLIYDYMSHDAIFVTAPNSSPFSASILRCCPPTKSILTAENSFREIFV